MGTYGKSYVLELADTVALALKAFGHIVEEKSLMNRVSNDHGCELFENAVTSIEYVPTLTRFSFLLARSEECCFLCIYHHIFITVSPTYHL